MRLSRPLGQRLSGSRRRQEEKIGKRFCRRGGLDFFGSAPVYALDHDDEDNNLMCNRAVQDGGAASVLGSIVYVKR